MTVTPVIKVALPRPIYSTYEYSINPAQETPCIGGRVAVPFGKSSEEIGICIQAQIMSKRTDLKSISKILDTGWSCELDGHSAVKLTITENLEKSFL